MNLKFLSMKKLTIFLAFLLFVAFQAAAQMQITGTVTGAEDGLSIPGVSVVVKGNATIGTTTDIDGKYSLTIPSSAEAVVFSFVGMKAQEVVIAGQSVIDVQMVAEVLEMDAVIVTAIGIKREAKALGFSATSVNNDEITKARKSNVVEGLQGKIAGVQISGTSGEPGSSMSIAIRGHSSINANEPLYVVDGVPLSNNRVGSGDELNGGFDMGNGLNTINPDDVANMTILKGAAATALYGSRAANGAVIITTKTGKSGEGLGVSYNGMYGVTQVLRTPTFQNDFGQGWDGYNLLIENGSWGPAFNGETRIYQHVVGGERLTKPYEAVEDNYKDFFDLGSTQQHSISISGAEETTSYFFSYSYADQDGIYPTDADSYTRNTFSLKGDKTINRVKISSSINYTNEKASAVPTGQGITVLSGAYQFPRDYSLVDGEDYTNKFYDVDHWYNPYGSTNPYYVLDNYGAKTEKHKVFGKLQLDVDITEWLDFTYRLGGDFDATKLKTWNPILIPTVGSPNAGSSTSDLGQVSESMNSSYQLNHDFLLNFNKDFLTDINVNGIIGYNINQRQWDAMAITVNGLDIPEFYHISNSAGTPVVGQRLTERRLVGLFGQAEVSYKNMVYMTVTARNDWSSTLPKDNNSYFYPGATLSFLASEILPDNIKSILSFAKVRAAYGKTGRDATSYLINPTFGQSSVYNPFRNLNFPLSGTNAFEVGNRLGNSELQPEITTEMEFGLDLRFFNNRIGLDVAYFDKDVEDQILGLTIPSTTGYTQQTMNLGLVTATGIEVALNLTPIKTKDFEWNINIVYNKTTTEVVELAENLDNVYIDGFSGIGIYAKVGEPMGVIMATGKKTTEDGRTIVDNSGMPLNADEPYVIGNSEYDWTGGLTNTLSYKGLSFSFSLDARQGGVMYSRTKDLLYFTGNSIETTYNDREPFVIPGSVVEIKDADGIVTGYEANTTPISKGEMDNFYSDGGLDAGSAFLIDKSFVKLRNVTITYNIPKKIMGKLPIQGASVSLIGTNLLLWTPEGNSFVDPETSSWGTDIGGKFGEYLGTPSSRTYALSLRINL
jgi:TonB-linked SusC/RagA family outer membrane protein